MFSKKKVLRLPKDRSLTLLVGIPVTGKRFLANKMKAVNSKKRIIISMKILKLELI